MNTFNDLRKYTENVEVNYYTWLKNLFTPATENIFPKWQYYVDQKDHKRSVLLRCCERDLKSQQIVQFDWKPLCVHITYVPNGKRETFPINFEIDKIKNFDIFEKNAEPIVDVIFSMLNPLNIS